MVDWWLLWEADGTYLLRPEQMRPDVIYNLPHNSRFFWGARLGRSMLYSSSIYLGIARRQSSRLILCFYHLDIKS